MHCYKALDRAALAILARQPVWRETPALSHDVHVTPTAMLDQIRSIVSDDDNVPASDALVRHLATAGRDDRDAITVLLAGHSLRIQGRLRDRALHDYHSDVISQLAVVLMTDSLDGDRLAKRFVNRAHQAIFYAEWMTTARQEGNVAIDTFEPEIIGRMAYERTVVDDIADNVIDRFDLVRFRARVTEAIANGHLATHHWEWLHDYRLVPAMYDVGTRASFERARGCRGVQRIRALAELHLCVHAA